MTRTILSVLLFSIGMLGCGDDTDASHDARTDDATPADAGRIDASTVDAGGCAPSESTCGGDCVDTSTNADHCNGCNMPCGIGQGCVASDCVDETPATGGDLTVEVVAQNLQVVWEIRFLPDGDLLVTERPGRVTRVAISDGTPTVLGTLPVSAVGEGGLMGLALDPDFETTQHIYVCYTYDDGERQNKVSRLDYSAAEVSGELVLLDGIAGANNHNGCRIGFGPDGKLYVTTGDATNPSTAQDLDSLSGKVLRMNRDGSIPGDNPFTDSYVYTWGHRNAQGLDWHPSGVAFVSEHGPTTDDEVNRLLAGENYGWPMYGGAPGEPGFEDAIYDWTPTVAPAGAVFYYGSRITGWRGSYLMLTLKERDIRRLTPANDDFTAVESEDVLLNNMYGRLRAIRVGPDGWVYVGTSNRDGRGAPVSEDDRILRIRL